MNDNNSHLYDDIINLPHHVSAERAHMPLCDRAAQFSSFAALSGYEDAVRETARLTDCKAELTEDEENELNIKLNYLIDNAHRRPKITVEYFVPDEKKEGGEYAAAEGLFRCIDEYARTIVFEGGASVPIDSVYFLKIWE